MVSDGGDAAQASAFVAMLLSAVHLEQHHNNSHNRNCCAAVTCAHSARFSQAHFKASVLKSRLAYLVPTRRLLLFRIQSQSWISTAFLYPNASKVHHICLLQGYYQ